MTDDFGFSRRQLIGGGTIFATSVFAGCGGALPTGDGDSATRTPGSLEHLKQSQLYVAPEVSLSLPDGVSQADSPENADLVVLPASTDVAPATARDWLIAGKGIALVGTDAQSTYIQWHHSEAFQNTFGGAYAKGDPPPELLVAFTHDRKFSSYSTSGGRAGSLTNVQLLMGLEDAVAAEQTRTPSE